MKKILFKSVAIGGMLVAMSATVNAQWTRNAGTLQTYLTNTGDNVGIGTTNPIYKLDVRNAGIATMQFKSNTENANILLDKGADTKVASLNYRTAGATNWQTGCVQNSNYTIRNFNTGIVAMHFDYVTNNVGVGTTAPNAKLDVAGTVRVNDNYIYLRGSTNTDHFLGYDGTVNGPLLSGFDGGALGGTVPNATILRWSWDGFDGKVGIGTNTPAYKLDVCGTIRATEVRIETGWCDYVFASDYKLKSIDEVAAYINDHKHLPGIVPASEVEKEGMKVGEMSKAMMEKIEELMLYVIDQNNQIKELKKQNELQQQQIDNLKK